MTQQREEFPPSDQMLIEVRSDNSIEGSEALVAHAEEAMHKAFGRYSSRITRIDVHLSDANGAKGGGSDMHCNLEVRLAGKAPVAATAKAATLNIAIRDAVSKMKAVIEHAVAH